MTDDKKTAETIEDKDLDKAEGGYSVWIGGSVRRDSGEVMTDRTATETRMNKSELAEL